MRIGLVGPQSSTERLIALTKNKYTYIELLPLNYQKFSESLELVQSSEKNLDALLFTGQTPYRYVTNFLTPKIPWEHIPRSSMSICTALIQASKYFRHPGSNIIVSMDNFDNAVLNIVLEECTYNNLHFQFFNTTQDILAPDYFEQIIYSHLYNIREHQANFCLTGTQYPYDVLKKQNIPVIKVLPDIHTFQEKLELLCFKHRLKNKSISDKIAVIIIDFNFTNIAGDIYESELYQLKATMQAAEDISYFAANTGAATFQTGQTQFFLTLSANALLLETDNLRHISLLRSVMDSSTLSATSIGIGIANTAYNAKTYALKAVSHACREDNFCCYAMDDGNYLIGPITPAFRKAATIQDDSLVSISQKTGVSQQSLKTLWQILLQYHLDCATPAQLAHYCNISTRSINRILEKLIDNGYAQIVGKQIADNAKGRPSRIIKFNFNNL